jgi:hypothetical protein
MPSNADFAFVLGTGRCGSTLVHEILARHPDVGFVSNLEDRFGSVPMLGRFNNPLYRRVPDRFTRKGRLRFAPSEAYRALEREVSPAISAPVRDLLAEDVTPWLERRFRTFFESRASRQGRPVFLHKFTGWPRSGFVRRIFPEARFVHVVRDGRAVANSFLQMPWWRGYGGPEAWTWGPLSEAYAAEWEASGRSFAVLAGLEWMQLIDAFESAKEQVPTHQWLEVRYEDFVAAPRVHMAAMLEHLGLEWTAAFEEGFGRYRFDAGRTESYRRDLGIHEVAMLDASLAPALARYGYANPQTTTPAAARPPRQKGDQL